MTEPGSRNTSTPAGFTAGHLERQWLRHGGTRAVLCVEFKDDRAFRAVARTDQADTAARSPVIHLWTAVRFLATLA